MRAGSGLAFAAKHMPGITISITRSSVCAGDDVDAPHEKEIVVSPKLPTRIVITSILDSGYLPIISGGAATWVIKGDGKIGVAAQQWRQPKFSIDADSPIDETTREKRKISFEYYDQKEPDGFL